MARPYPAGRRSDDARNAIDGVWPAPALAPRYLNAVTGARRAVRLGGGQPVYSMVARRPLNSQETFPLTDRSPTAGQRPNTKIDTTRPHDPGTILTQTARTLDFAQPIALILQGILGHVPDEDGPGEIVARLVDALPSGSYVVIADGTNPTGAGLPDEVDGFGGVARKP